MSKIVSVKYESTGFCGLLTIAFIVLKLTGFIDWSWLWVLSPLWIPFVLALGFFGLTLLWACAVMLGAAAAEAYKAKKKRRDSGQFGS